MAYRTPCVPFIVDYVNIWLVWSTNVMCWWHFLLNFTLSHSHSFTHFPFTFSHTRIVYFSLCSLPMLLPPSLFTYARDRVNNNDHALFFVTVQPLCRPGKLCSWNKKNYDAMRKSIVINEAHVRLSVDVITLLMYTVRTSSRQFNNISCHRNSQLVLGSSLNPNIIKTIQKKREQMFGNYNRWVQLLIGWVFYSGKRETSCKSTGIRWKLRFIFLFLCVQQCSIRSVPIPNKSIIAQYLLQKTTTTARLNRNKNWLQQK